MKKEKKKVLYRFGLPIILGTILLLGVSYAWLSLTLTGTKTNVLKAGTLSLVLDDTTGEGINITGAVPMLDEVGESQSPYTFTLTNNGTVESEYTIYLDDVALESNETRLSDSVIKYNLVKDGSSSTALLSTLGSNPNRVLDSGVIGPEESHSYELRLWLDENMTNTDMGKVFRGKIRVVAEQVIEEAPLPSTDESCFVTSDLEDGTVRITRYICGPTFISQPNTNPVNDIVDVVIPSTINGKQVTIIASLAFGGTSLSSVIIPNSVTSIGDAAFQNNQLTTVIIPDGVITIGEDAFSGNQLTSIAIPNSVISIGRAAFVYSGLTSVEFSEGVTTIGEMAFENNQLTSITLPKSITTIGSNTFSGNQLTSVTIKGKSSSVDFDYYGEDIWGWASGYSDANIVWQP